MNDENYVKVLSADEWRGVECDETTIQNPTEAAVAAAIKALDAETRTLVTLQGSGEAHMAVGGGIGKFVVYATRDNYTFHNLLASTTASGTVAVVAGGQEGDYPADQVVGLEAAVEAALCFLRTGELASGLTWREQE